MIENEPYNKTADELYEKERNGTVVEIAKGTAENINLSLIATKLIKEVGTLCKQYASDFLITWNELMNIINTTAGYAVADKYVIFFGIRKNGIDSNDFMVIRLTENPKYKYEAIYAVTVLRIPEDQEITCILKEINQE